MLRIIFCAEDAFIRVEPDKISGPTSAQMVTSATCERSEFGLQVMAAVLAPRVRAYSVAPTTYGFHLVDVRLEHDDGDGNGFSRRLDGADRGVAVDVADLHQNANAELDELGVLHVYVDHQIVVHVAESRHGAGGDHVEDHLLGGRGLHACGA